MSLGPMNTSTRVHDACGIGFVADSSGRRSHRVLQLGIEALARMAHRGAVAADGLTSDGVGLLTQIPYALFKRVLVREGIAPENPRDIAVGMFFFPREEEARKAAMRIVEEQLEQLGLGLQVWRRVPTQPEVLGEVARSAEPAVWQAVMIKPANLSRAGYERALYRARRRSERAWKSAGIEAYALSLSSERLVYKGLMLARDLAAYYPDLADPYYQTALTLFHQRYSTNTFPAWSLAQPFRYLAHNGEINTLQGNVNWMRAREPELISQHWGEALEDLKPVVEIGGSDSAVLDNVFELLVQSGRDPLHAMMMLVPEAYENVAEVDPQVRAFFEYHASMTEPWDGPAALVYSDGRYAAASLDRNGLRPLRYWILDDGLVVLGSETGIVDAEPERIVEKGRLGPGQIFAVDTEKGRIYRNDAIKQRYATRRPYAVWVRRHRTYPPKTKNLLHEGRDLPSGEEFVRLQKAFGYSREDLTHLLAPMSRLASEPVGSMGDDTPLPFLSERPQWLYRYFRQRFAQVTNPPIDPLREEMVMSLRSLVGPRMSFLEEQEGAAHQMEFDSPIVHGDQLAWIQHHDDTWYRPYRLRTRFPSYGGPEAMKRALDALLQEAQAAVEQGFNVLVLTDRGVGPEWAPIPMPLVVGGVHHHLIRLGRRMRVSLVVETGEVRQDHHYAVLLGYGADLIYPYLALASVRDLVERDPRGRAPISLEQALLNYQRAVEKGLRKILAKMGISTLASYRGAQIFEVLGLEPAVVEAYFNGTPARFGAIGLERIALDVLAFHEEAYAGPAELADRGEFRFRKRGEYHAFNPQVFKPLHRAVREEKRESYDAYARAVNERPPTAVRDLLTWKPAAEPVPLDEVEPVEAILERFRTQAMSFGALSREAHEVLAVAMNRIGAMSNSGEGGEDPVRYHPYKEDRPDLTRSPWHPQAGDWGNSKVKQVASGRFGVTPSYLVSAEELEIKMAQGSKPGEGGQIPGFKVNREIARVRGATPGVTLISPPPHHDIYSIEDLAQLIYDLKRVNKKARVGVKLVSEIGVGTIAAGVAKGYADRVLISGADGGTGASPLGSIKYAGSPWELGLAEAHRVLLENGLRSRVRLQVDGGLKTGRDVVLAALLGAEEFGFGTAALVAVGCVMARQCHLNTCPVGVATQNEELRRRFPGTPEHAVRFLAYVAQEVREILAGMGVRRLDEIVGRNDLLKPREVPLARAERVQLEFLLAPQEPWRPEPPGGRAERPEEGPLLDDQVHDTFAPALQDRKPRFARFAVRNRERAVGARLAGEIARFHGQEGLPPGTVHARFDGVAGQSFGVFLSPGMFFELVGEAQDYLAKGMAGGVISVRPQIYREAPEILAGNTVLYGATGGALYVAGRVGERFAVRNSGARAVVEGVGEHACEYMTGGLVVVLGATGQNFAAGMTGGIAYVYDPESRFPERYNPTLVKIERVHPGVDEELLRAMLERHRTLTRSPRAARILDAWEEARADFWKVSPETLPEGTRPGDEEALLLEAVRAEATVEPAGDEHALADEAAGE
ncbi:MAG TPA: glutamate synthase large subunit [Oceanithermus profundus]|uniref:Glutamate synthase large subunit n=1 Tax=Oceanithermus profundus TaxID=187137 RepID=A0A7C4VKR0_9DEIN|nr:glutamate synthase large subunit [Oceanithermus profundus]